ncbi:unnamed protein product [Rhizophagus irregularis]|nr:unnamed protein product [Rhizophagus irregularis]CAB4419769.1 unnamed protein product [Rhizophagus irregularis]CAB4438253.1 unnamed protein product [Rhizophagus irregularis]CAB4446531.1 unnamed protein product [Rhizophagus irregularis]
MYFFEFIYSYKALLTFNFSLFLDGDSLSLLDIYFESSGRVRFRQFLQISMDMNFGKVGNPVLPRCITLQILGSFWVTKQLIAPDLQRFPFP